MHTKHYDLLLMISPHKKATKIVEFARKEKVLAASLSAGLGTANNNFLKFLSLDSITKDIIWLILEKNMSAAFLNRMATEFDLDRPNSGIVARIPLLDVAGLEPDKAGAPIAEETGVEPTIELDPAFMHELLFLIVDRNTSDEAIEIAQTAGAIGATIIHARGLADYRQQAFDFVLEPEKDIVLMVLPQDKAEIVASRLSDDLKLDMPNTGIAFSLPVLDALGLAEPNPAEQKNSNASCKPASEYACLLFIAPLDKFHAAVNFLQQHNFNGGTHYTIRGSKTGEEKKFLNTTIEPRKEILIIVDQQEVIEDLAVLVEQEFDLANTQHGLLYIAPVIQVKGLRS